MSWTAIFVLAAGAYLFKLGGLVLADRLGDGLWRRAVLLLPPALFTAVIMLQTFERNGGLSIDARVVGVAVAVIAAAKRLPFVAVIVIAMVTTAVVRAAGL